jgi:hypothetical protein
MVGLRGWRETGSFAEEFKLGFGARSDCEKWALVETWASLQVHPSPSPLALAPRPGLAPTLEGSRCIVAGASPCPLLARASARCSRSAARQRSIRRTAVEAVTNQQH